GGGDPPGRQAALRSAQRSHLTHGFTLLHFPGCPRGRFEKVPASERKRRASGGFPARGSPASPEASGASRGLFHAVPKARSLKTQQRAFTSRPHPSWMWLRTKPVSILRDGTLSTSSK